MSKTINSFNSDKFLVLELKTGCIKAYEELFERYNNKLYYFALKYLNSEIEAEGIVQDVFSKVWEKRESLKPECSFKSYIFTIAFNLIKKIYIKRSRLREYLNTEEGMVDTDLHTVNQIDYNFTMDRLKSLVSKMPERRRETFTKSRFEGLSIKEIAQEMNVSPKTVENQITSALKFLKSNLNIENVVE